MAAADENNSRTVTFIWLQRIGSLVKDPQQQLVDTFFSMSEFWGLYAGHDY